MEEEEEEALFEAEEEALFEANHGGRLS